MSAGADRQSALALDDLRIQADGVAHLDIDGKVRLVHVDAQPVRQRRHDRLADAAADLGRGQGELLVAAPALHLEAEDAGRIGLGAGESDRLGQQRLKAAPKTPDRTGRHDAENRHNLPDGLFQILLFVVRFDPEPRLRLNDAE